MTVYSFKLMGTLHESGQKEIDISGDPNLTVGEVKEQVRKSFKMPPSIKITILVGGKTLQDNHHKWHKVVSINPRKEVIRIMGTRAE